MFYDPRGQVIRTLNPDGSEQRVIYGIPADLERPRPVRATPWEAYTYDANDLAPLSQGAGWRIAHRLRRRPPIISRRRAS